MITSVYDDPSVFSDDFSSYHCSSVAQAGTEQIFEMRCDRTTTARVDLLDTDCNVDLFLLGAACDPAADCIAHDDGLPSGEFVSFLCEEGLTYYLSVEPRGGHYSPLTCPIIQDLSVGGRGRGSNATLVPTCVEVCDDGYDNDRDGVADCDDDDCELQAECCDQDQDGWPAMGLLCGGDDCDDQNADVYPGATEIAYDGIDQDCDGGDLNDLDRDGSRGGPGGPDCDDNDRLINPFAPETVADGIDQNCDGVDNCWRDDDGDGVGVTLFIVGDNMDCDDGPNESSRFDDCDDTRPDLSPLLPDIPYDGIDQDCSGADLVDVDGDGSPGGPSGTDCVDTEAAIFPGAEEVPNGVDEDCDGLVDDGTDRYDDDGDGFSELGGDCDDDDVLVRPGGVERPNGTDEDCDGVIDEGTTFYDDDGDGQSEDDGDCNDADPFVYAGAPETVTSLFDANCDGLVPGVDGDGDGYTARGGDCDDSDEQVYPGAPERENFVDDDCDGDIDDGTTLFDDDRDGLTEREGDCDDSTAARGPEAEEDIDNGVDDDCDGVIDNGGPFTDDDGDGFAEDGGDCDDDDPDVYPYAPERDNDVDDNCDGRADEFIDDADGDGVRADEGDCDDLNGWVHPGEEEVCDSVDNDCDGLVDEGCIGREDEPDPDLPEDPEGCQGCAGSPGPVAWPLLMLGLCVRRRRTTPMEKR